MPDIRSTHRIACIVSLLLLSLLLSSCSHRRYTDLKTQAYHPQPHINHHTPTPVKTGAPYQVAGVWYYPIASNKNYNRTGMASWYGKKFHGKKTANGERYDMYAMTAAHTTLPMPSNVRVTNLENGRSVIVRVNDRGPFVKDRIIDLSYAAAKALGYVEQGTAHVRVQTLNANGRTNNTASTPHQRERIVNGQFYVQVAAFSAYNGASDMQQQLRRHHPSAKIYHTSGDKFYRVRLGPFKNEMESNQMKLSLQNEGYAQPMVVVR